MKGTTCLHLVLATLSEVRKIMIIERFKVSIKMIFNRRFMHGLLLLNPCVRR